MSIYLARPVATIYPNGEFTIGMDSVKRMNPEHVRSAPERVKNMFWGALDDRMRSECKRIASNRVMESALGSSQVVNSPKRRRGLRGIGNRASRMVRNMAFVLEKENPRRNLAFVTLTLPELEPGDHASVCQNWHDVVKVFWKKLGRIYEKKSGKRLEQVSVTEVQEKRYERSGYLGLHLHSLFVGRFHHKSEWILTRLEIRNAWQQAIEKHCKREYDFCASENCQSVRKSASAYLGKYLSKGVSALRRIVAKGVTELLPHTWYSRSISLLRRVRQRIRRSYSAGDFLSRRFTRRLTLNTVFFYREIMIDTPIMDNLIVGYVGRFKSSIDIFNCEDILGLLTRFEDSLCTTT